MHLTIVCGARPNFVKVAPLIHQIQKKQKNNINLKYSLVHTGQHYNDDMSKSFFDQLEIPKPNVNLNAGGGSHAKVTASIMILFEDYLMKNKTNLVIVVGDVTSTMACAITAQKLHIKVAHIESGIRSYDWKMPEEINRLVTDSITNYFFTTTELASKNLISSGVKKKNIFFVGNTMIDSLVSNKKKLIRPSFWNNLNLSNKKYIIITLHRPSNVDEIKNLKLILSVISENVRNYPVIFPAHPRTKKNITKIKPYHNIHIINPLTYLEFNYLLKNSLAVITDSGGITEETTVYGVPCLTLRDNTERPETVSLGTNELIGSNPKKIIPAINKIFNGKWKKGLIPKYWDGKTSKRIIEILIKKIRK